MLASGSFMRATSLPWLILPLLFTECGSRQDLLIGELFDRSGAGSAGATNAGTAGDTSSGAGGATSVAGSSEVGGSAETAGAPDAAGAAGAGMAGAPDETCQAGEEPPLDSLIHRYSFDGSGTVATDSVGGQDGTIVGASLTGTGTLTTNGTDVQFVDLPNRIISSLTDVTIVTWTNWVDGAAYGRVFDFGISDTQVEGQRGAGRSYVAVMPKTGFDNQAKPGLGGEIKVPGFDTVTLASTENMKNRAAQVSLVFRGGVSAALYIDGNLLAIQPTAITLADIDDRNNWIGQSQYQSNPPYQGGFEEFRIYNAALDACQLHTLLVRGPETP